MLLSDTEDMTISALLTLEPVLFSLIRSDNSAIIRPMLWKATAKENDHGENGFRNVDAWLALE